MEKNKILSKLNINIRDYNNELEKILENKLFSFEVKNLLLSMLYKIENAYKDYETVKVEVPAKEEYIENILRIIKEKCLKILLVKIGTSEAEELETNNLAYKIDKKNGEIICFQNELVILTAILKLDETDVMTLPSYEYLIEPLNVFLNKGILDSNVEVIRDFNGWSWDIVTKEINDIETNYMYQTMLLLNGRNNINSQKNKEIYNHICRMAVEKYISSNKDFAKKFKTIKKEKKARLELFENKKDFLNKVTEEKKEYMKKIERIDRTLNNSELLKNEYYSRNEKLPNREKIFSVNYLIGILNKERNQFIEKIEECNEIILPKEYINQKNKLEEENNFLNNVKQNLEENEAIELFKEFLCCVDKEIDEIKEENKSNLTRWVYKLRYFRYIPFSKEKNVKDLHELDLEFEKVFKKIIAKAQELKLWDNFSEDSELTYRILKEIFDTKIIFLQNINIYCDYNDGILTVSFYDDNIIENSIKIEIEKVKIKKKFKLFI